MGDPEKKRLKAEAKAAKKRAKAEAKQEHPATAQPTAAPESSSPALRVAEGVRGVLYVLLAVSLLVAILLGEQGVIITLDRIVGSLMLAWTGKVVLVVLALALFIYGLKHLRLVR